MEENLGDILVYQRQDGSPEVEVRLQGETIWLSQKMMADLFERDTDTISLHLANIYKEGELDENRTTEFFSVVQTK